jgi:hypothetical protein
MKNLTGCIAHSKFSRLEQGRLNGVDYMISWLFTIFERYRTEIRLADWALNIQSSKNTLGETE